MKNIRKNKIKWIEPAFMIAVLLMLAGCALSGGSGEDGTENANIQLQILATSDMHGRFMPYNYIFDEEDLSGSCAQIATAVNELRNENTIVVDAGDIIQDNSAELFLNDEMHPMMLAMNDIQYDVWTTGNHEYNFGMDVLKRIIPQNSGELICGNVYDPDGERLAPAYTIIERNGVKVGIIGMVTPNIQRWDSTNLTGYTITDPVEETKKAIKELEGKVDVLIALDHMDVNNELDVSGSGVEDLANACPELDLIIAAHGHKMIDDLTINGVPIIENKNYAETLGRILIDLTKTDEGWEVNTVSTKILMMEDYLADEAMVTELFPYHERAIEDAHTVYGHLNGEYMANPETVNGVPAAVLEDTPFIDLLNHMQLYYSGADISASILCTEDANIYGSEIRKCDIYRAYKFPNYLCTVQMTGSQLKKLLEYNAAYYNTYKEGDEFVSADENYAIYLYNMFSGINYDINISKEAGERIENLTWPDGSEVLDDDIFTLATNNYYAGSYLTNPGPIYEEGDTPIMLENNVRSDIGGIQELLTDYIVNVMGGEINLEVDNNWKLTGML